MTSVLVVEDDSFVRATVTTALKFHEFKVVDSVGTSVAAMDAFREHMPDVALLDLDLGGGPTGADLAVGMRRLKPELGVVFLTSFEDPRLLDSRLTNMPERCGYVVKQSLQDTEFLAAAIRGSDDPGEIPRVDLTESQAETLRLVAAGLSNAEIARIRVVEVSAVEKAIRRAADVLGIHGDETVNQRVALARAYYRMAGLGRGSA
ncbi:MAG TPA: response regulator [Candidatus Nanopelagicales bacterium]|nr:response regulator [Candidatus Nanopelagicales bacterium]